MPPSPGSGVHQTGGLKILDQLIDGVDHIGQGGVALERAHSSSASGIRRAGRASRTSRTGRTGRGDVIRKVAITLENQGKIKK